MKSEEQTACNNWERIGILKGRKEVLEEVMKGLDVLIEKSREGDEGITDYCILTKDIEKLKQKIEELNKEEMSEDEKAWKYEEEEK